MHNFKRNQQLSYFASNAGDVNGDGFDDLIITAFSVSPDTIESPAKSYVVISKSNGFGANIRKMMRVISVLNRK
ncbi:MULTISPECIES: FG-GAP repeat protein [unclassified Nostoc]|uniref:FG-GAP repeat protein n=1 Tax=unclassified Nostoc TaxID=2593658 RepID=UPI00262295CD|nr:FG-GAP repeat protein [Nostoc sp. S13]MDF5739597.1 FG-GAP repeat protein [Nostoc sp. S13]